MKLTIQPDGTQVLEGTATELAEFQKLNPPLIKVVGEPMISPIIGPRVPDPYGPFNPLKPYGDMYPYPYQPAITWCNTDSRLSCSGTVSVSAKIP